MAPVQPPHFCTNPTFSACGQGDARDTAGEKREEKFVGARESKRAWLPALEVVQTHNDAGPAVDFAEWLKTVIGNPRLPVTMSDLSKKVAQAIPEFSHVEGLKRLDDRI